MVKNLRIFLLFLLVLSTGGIYYQFLSTQINILSLVIAAFLYLSSTNDFTKISSRIIIVVVFLILFLATNFLANYSSVVVNLKDYLSLSVRMIIALSLLYSYNFNSKLIIKDLYFLLFIFLLHGAINIVVVSIFSKNSFKWNNEIYHYGVNSIYYVFFYGEKNGLIRNTGMFWEPGVFQFVINLYFFLRIFVFKRLRIYALLFGLVMILSTQSTVGIFIFSMIIFTYYLSNINIRNIFVLIFIFIFAYVLFFPSIKDKFIGVNKLSYQARVFDTASGISAIFSSPFFGNGYTPNDITYITYNEKNLAVGLKYSELNSMHKRGNTNSIIACFIYWGIPFSILLLLLLYNQKIIIEHKFLFFMMNFITCVSEPLLFTGIFMLLIISGLSSIHLLKLKHESC